MCLICRREERNIHDEEDRAPPHALGLKNVFDINTMIPPACMNYHLCHNETKADSSPRCEPTDTTVRNAFVHLAYEC